MVLNDFSITKERALPILILADTSGSMKENGKIQALNMAIQRMIVALRNVEDIRGIFKVSIITFGDEKVEIQQYPTDVNTIVFEELEANGSTPMGTAIAKVTELVEDKSVIKSKDYLPTIVLISDGYATDYPKGKPRTIEDYLKWEPIVQMHEGERSKKCLRLALSVDSATDKNMLQAFLNNGTSPIEAVDAEDIIKAFQWITMSSISRMSSVNPNDIGSFLKFEDAEYEDDVII